MSTFDETWVVNPVLSSVDKIYINPCGCFKHSSMYWLSQMPAPESDRSIVLDKSTCSVRIVGLVQVAVDKL